MPYAIKSKDGQFQVVNTETGHVKGTFSSRKKAMRQFRLLQGVEHGWKPTKAAAGAVVTTGDLLLDAYEELHYAETD